MVEFRKDIYNDEYFTGLGLNERQIKAVLYVKEKGKITNSDYQEINEIAERTASRDLADLVSKKIIINSGLKGAGAFYTLTNSITPITPITLTEKIITIVYQLFTAFQKGSKNFKR